MKLRFEPDLSFQLDAIRAICDVFEGQEQQPSAFTVLSPQADLRLAPLGQAATQGRAGVGEHLELSEQELLANLRRVQLRHGLPPSTTVDLDDLNLTVEMETGTGKTYVYLRTIYELNRRYGFSKFIVVVPSLAIKEGVAKSLSIMREHFAELYDNPPFDWFIYDSANLGQLHSFTTSPQIQVMVATIQALHKTDQRLFHQRTEKLAGARPIELIRQLRPIVIVDEPQSVDGGDRGAGREALREMTPLCTLRYSATHVDQHDMVYRLDAIDAYEQRLVKGIEVATARVEGSHDRPYLRVVEICRKGATSLFARLELDCAGGPDGVRRRVRSARQGDDLERLTGRAIYRDHRVGEIVRSGRKRQVQLLLPAQDLWLDQGATHGDLPIELLQRLMIRRTIRQHLDRERELRPRGIKVLSLFFVDEVAHYRSYDDAGQPVMGKYARIFHEEYQAAARHRDHRSLLDDVDPTDTALVHDGYFSIDKKRRWVDTNEGNQRGRQAAEAAYSLIMRDKERLLSLETPLRFIFSHSALREGWDNPNVFQICSLRELGTERQRRQSIGRGLRLCVDQDGCRVRDDDINRLTVIAPETVAQFAQGLQQELEAETGVRFGVVDKDSFSGVPVLDEDGQPTALGRDRSGALWTWLRTRGFIDRKGKVQPSLGRALDEGSLPLPDRFEGQRRAIERLLRKLTKGIEVHDADRAPRVRAHREVLDSAELRALWDRVQRRTAYQLSFDPDALVASCVDAMADPGFAPRRARLSWVKADIEIDEAGVRATGAELVGTRTLSEHGLPLPDILTELQDKTGLTRRSLARILTESDQLWRFQESPQAFISAVADLINHQRRRIPMQGLKYERLGDSDTYRLSLVEPRELTAFIARAGAVKLTVRLPAWFEIPTPIGTCKPDRAVLLEDDGDERLYFVVDSRGDRAP